MRKNMELLVANYAFAPEGLRHVPGTTAKKSGAIFPISDDMWGKCHKRCLNLEFIAMNSDNGEGRKIFGHPLG